MIYSIPESVLPYDCVEEEDDEREEETGLGFGRGKDKKKFIRRTGSLGKQLLD